MDSLADMSLRDFTGALSSTSPTPGGGGAAAMTGALAASLCAMAAGITAGNKKFIAVRGEAETVANEAEALRLRFLELAEEDERAFAPLSKAYSMDKTAPDYAETLRRASLGACEPPMELLRRCAELTALIERLYKICSPMLLSDAGCAATLCAGAMRAAEQNVLVNTRSLKNDGEAEKLSRQAAALVLEYIPRAEAVSNKVKEYLTS